MQPHVRPCVGQSVKTEAAYWISQFLGTEDLRLSHGMPVFVLFFGCLAENYVGPPVALWRRVEIFTHKSCFAIVVGQND